MNWPKGMTPFLTITRRISIRKDVMYMESMTRCRPGWKVPLVVFATALCLVSLFPSVNAYAKLVLYSFEEKISRSEAIVIGKVVKKRKSLFREDTAFIRTSKVIKGDFKEREFIVKYGQPFFYAKEDTTEFVENESYVLFLTPYNSCYRLLAAHDGYYHIRDGRTVRHEQKDFLLEDFIKAINKYC
jgi:hypothetical protein